MKRLDRNVVNSLLSRHRNQGAAGVVTVTKRQAIKDIVSFHLLPPTVRTISKKQIPKRLAIVKDGSGLSIALYSIDDGGLPTFICMGAEYKDESLPIDE